jgi:hypothetical protein
MMSQKNLTESGFNPVTVFVPLFTMAKTASASNQNLERFGAWSFEMESDLRQCNSLIEELFTAFAESRTPTANHLRN